MLAVNVSECHVCAGTKMFREIKASSKGRGFLAAAIGSIRDSPAVCRARPRARGKPKT